MSVYVALDASGEAVEMKGGDGQYSSPNKTDRGQTGYKAFVKHLVKRYGGSDYIPDFNIRRFDFPNQWKVPVFRKGFPLEWCNKLNFDLLHFFYWDEVTNWQRFYFPCIA